MKGQRRKRAALGLSALVLALAAGCGGDSGGRADEAAPQPYRGLQGRAIRALSPATVEELLAGQGAGYALAAELNHYPGPAHVLELERQLGLTEGQEQAVRAVRSEMRRDARRLGRELVDLEKQLDGAFRRGRITAGEVVRLTARIAEVEGRLRATHLRAHLEVERALTRDQIARYDQLRGYAAEHAPAGMPGTTRAAGTTPRTEAQGRRRLRRRP